MSKRSSQANGLRALSLALIVVSVFTTLASGALARGQTTEHRQTDEAPDVQAPREVASTDVSGAQHWAVLMCKFPDVPGEPRGAAFFEEMFSRSSGPSLEDYWREVSYGAITDVTAEASGWFTLPEGRAYYGYSETTPGFDVDTLIQHCMDTADPTVNFASFDAVAVMLNSPSPVAIATRWPLLYPDGAVIDLGAIAIPSDKHRLALLAHEMGHAYGLPHSRANGVEYTNPWDLMGTTSGYRCSVNADPIYSCLGQHTIAYYKNYLGWIPPERVFEAPMGSSTVTLERLALPQTDNPLLAIVEGEGIFYTIEARQRVGYDEKLAADAVLIHRDGDDLVDADGAAPHDDAGAMWLPGETFRDASAGVEIRVDAATATGFSLTIIRSGPPEPAVRLLSSSVAPPLAAAGERVDFEWTVQYEDGAAGSADVSLEIELPTDLDYVSGSAEVDGPYSTQIVSESPLLIEIDELSTAPLTVRYAARIDAGMTASAWLAVPLEASWPGGSDVFGSVLLANGAQSFLPLITQQP